MTRLLLHADLRVLMPAVVIVLVTGVFMVLDSAEWHFSQFWVLLALGLFGLAFLIGGVYLGRVGITMKANVARQGVAPEARALLNRWLTGYGLVLVVLLVAVGDMVFKPGTG